ncbi:MAG: HAD family phosphatase [Treponema sp.]|nr:HAD family phosphatase [Treponema sp.]
MGIKAVVFDFGKVISFPPGDSVRDEMASLSGLSRRRFDELDRQYRDRYDLGIYNMEEYYRFLLSAAEIFPGKEIIDRIAGTDRQSWSRINPGTIDLIREIKKRGLKFGILSNMSHDFLSWCRQNVPVFTEADAAVFSCEAGSVKPEDAIYEIMVKALGCGYGEVVFFDDMEENVAKARSLGMRAFVWKAPEEAGRTLERLDPVFAGLPR